MFKVLVASAPARRGRPLFAAAASAVAHAGLAALALAGTQPAVALVRSGGHPERIASFARLAPPPAPPPPARRNTVDSSAGGARLSARVPMTAFRRAVAVGEGDGSGAGRGTRSRRAPAPAPRPREVALPEVPHGNLASDALVYVDSALARRVSSTSDFRRAPLLEELTPPPPTPLYAGVYREVDAERRPIPLVDSPLPDYPLEMLRLRVQGEVRAKFVIDSTGVPVMRSVEILASSDELFTRSVREVLRHLRYVPAQIAGRAVNVEVEQPFTFVVR